MALTNVVVRALPFQLTAELETKFVPFTVSVKDGAPAVALAGEREAILGTGFLLKWPHPATHSTSKTAIIGKKLFPDHPCNTFTAVLFELGECSRA